MRILQLLAFSLLTLTARADTATFGLLDCFRDFPSGLDLGAGVLLVGYGSSCDVVITPGEATTVTFDVHFPLQPSTDQPNFKSFTADITVEALLPATFNSVEDHPELQGYGVGVHSEVEGSYCAPFGCRDFTGVGQGIGYFTFDNDPKFCDAGPGKSCLEFAFVNLFHAPEPSSLALLGCIVCILYWRVAAQCAVRAGHSAKK